MRPVFQKDHVETDKDFQLLAASRKITFSYVYDSPGSVDLEFDLHDVEPDEQYLAFNLAEHGESGRRYFLYVGPVDLRAGRPSSHPVPYWISYIRGVGYLDDAYSLDD